MAPSRCQSRSSPPESRKAPRRARKKGPRSEEAGSRAADSIEVPLEKGTDIVLRVRDEAINRTYRVHQHSYIAARGAQGAWRA